MKNVKNRLGYGAICAVLCVIFLGLVICGIGLMSGSLSKKYSKMDTEINSALNTEETVQLYSIGSDKTYEGSFVLGTGTVKEKEYITAYQLTEDGGKRYYKMDKSLTTVYETLKGDEQAYAIISKNGSSVTDIKLYVPENTINREIDLDL